MEQAQKHSGIGIASFITSIIVGILMFLLVIVAGVMETSTPGGMDEKSAGAIIVGLGIFGLLFLDLVALGLGIGGLCQKERKKIMAILGTVFSVVILLGTLGLMVIGSMN